MKRLIILLFFITSSLTISLANAQMVYYNLSAEYPIERYSEKGPAAATSPMTKWYMKGWKNACHIIKKERSVDRYGSEKYTCLTFDLVTKQVLKTGTFELSDTLFFLDFIYQDGQYILCMSSKTVFFYDIDKKTLKSKKMEIAGIDLSRITWLDDTPKSLFYSIYPYHPLSKNIDSLQLLVYDWEKDSTVYYKSLPFEGISLGNINKEWVRVIGGMIYVAYPLTGKIFCYDFSLNLKDSFQVKLPELYSDRNRTFVQWIDAQKEKSDLEILNFLKTKDDDFLKENQITSSYYTKEALLERMDTLRTAYSYIEKLISMNDSILCISVRRPLYGEAVRDLYQIDRETGEVLKSWVKWQINRPESGPVRSVEEFFPINLLSSNLYAPYFFDDKAYMMTYLPASLFKPGDKKEIDKIYFRWNKDNEETVFLKEYQLLDP